MNGSAGYSWILPILAAAFCLWQARKYWLARASGDWPHTTGVVSKAYVDESRPDEDGDVSHSAHVRYSYTVGARRYVSTRLTYQPTSGLVFSRAVNLLHGITRGRETDVYYDPKNPARSVLIPGSSTDGLVHVVISVVVFAFLFWQAIDR